ncbi:MAG: bifunctional adenosylcobinamide kinase/adenosylcobinamide-phosphate guanylyltransferase [Ectobacillus sp.]
MTLTYITGGVRSGKSEFAERLAASGAGSVLYVAFGVAADEEMKSRIDLHKKRRPNDWDVLEKPKELIGYETVYQQYDKILVDCLSTWIANQCMDIPEHEFKNERQKARIIHEAARWLEQVRKLKQHVIVVSDEVGLGGVAISPLGRFFQDVLGKVNQLAAQAADEAYAVLSGLPVRMK